MRLLRIAETDIKEYGGFRFGKDLWMKRSNVLWFLLDVAKFDRDWSESKDFYVGPGGTGNAIKTRYPDFKKWLKENPEIPIIPPYVYVGEPYMGEVPGFSNGRHRFAVFRDMGLDKMWVVIDPRQKKKFEEKYS
jgi:hypothetical protein